VNAAVASVNSCSTSAQSAAPVTDSWHDLHPSTADALLNVPQLRLLADRLKANSEASASAEKFARQLFEANCQVPRQAVFH